MFIYFHYYPSRQLAYRAATKLLHPCLSLASLLMVPQLWFMFFSSASTFLSQVVFDRPHFRFPSGVQWIAFCDGVGILAQHMPKPAPSLLGGIRILLLAPCQEVTVGDGS